MRGKRQDFVKRLVTAFMVVCVMVALTFQAILLVSRENRKESGEGGEK